MSEAGRDSLPPSEGADQADAGPLQPMAGSGGAAAVPDARSLRRLCEEREYAKAAALLDGIDLDDDLPPDFLYHAAIALAGAGRESAAIPLMKRAAADGFGRFWCGFHLGLFERRCGNLANAAHYFATCAILNPGRTDVLGHLTNIVPDLDLALLRAAQTKSAAPAREALAIGAAKQRLRKAAAAACYLTVALALEPDGREARDRLLQLVPDVSLDVLDGIDMDRLAARLRETLTRPGDGDAELFRKLAWAQAVFEIYANNQHPSGRSVAPAIGEALIRALAARRIDLETLCLLHDKLYFLYWNWASSWEEMRGVSDRAMEPLAAAVREGTIPGLPAIVPRPLGSEPLRLAYLDEFAFLLNPIGRGVGDMLGLLSRYLPGAYELIFYAWSQYDEALLTALADEGIAVRRFTATSMTERVAKVAEAIAADRVDILISDMNSALPAVLFERRAAPAQIFFQIGLPFWPLANIDAVFRIEFYDSRLDGFDPGICFDLGLGPWQHRGWDHDPPIDPARIAAERALFPRAEKLIGIYGRLAKITPDFLETVEEILRRHPHVVALIGGTGYGVWIREFIAARGLEGRLVLVDETVDGHVWGHMIDVFIDTSWDVTVAGREIMAKGKPLVALRTPTHECERVPMLLAASRAEYIDIVSRLIEDPEFYRAACAATREFVAAQPGEREYAVAIHQALQAVISRVACPVAPPAFRGVSALDRLVHESALELIREEAPQSIETVEFPGGKPVEVVRVDDLVYLPDRHLQVWRDRVIPVEANTDPDAVPMFFDKLQNQGCTYKQFSKSAELPVNEVSDEEVCVLSNLHSNNFYHFLEELYKIVILERCGFTGQYVVSPFPTWIGASLPAFATELLRLVGIPQERLLSVAVPTLFRKAWLTTHIAHNNVASYPAVFFALREALLAGADGPCLGPRLWLDRRSGYRALVNREEVEECLKRHHFTIVEMSGLSVAQQIAAAAGAHIIAGPHGAAFAHSMFLPEHSTVIECFSPEYLNPCVLDICALLGHRYINLTYPAAPVAQTGNLGARLYEYGGDIAVDCAHLDLILQALAAGRDDRSPAMRSNRALSNRSSRLRSV